MQWKFHFRQLDTSKTLRDYTQAHFQRLECYLVKDSVWQIYFGMGKFDYQIEVVVSNPNGKFKATAHSKISFYAAVDDAVDKLAKQFIKQKSKLQHHKKFAGSKQGRLQRVNTLLEYDNGPSHRHRKSAA